MPCFKKVSRRKGSSTKNAIGIWFKVSKTLTWFEALCLNNHSLKAGDKAHGAGMVVLSLPGDIIFYIALATVNNELFNKWQLLSQCFNMVNECSGRA